MILHAPKHRKERIPSMDFPRFDSKADACMAIGALMRVYARTTLNFDIRLTNVYQKQINSWLTSDLPTLHLSTLERCGNGTAPATSMLVGERKATRRAPSGAGRDLSRVRSPLVTLSHALRHASPGCPRPATFHAIYVDSSLRILARRRAVP